MGFMCIAIELEVEQVLRSELEPLTADQIIDCCFLCNINSLCRILYSLSKKSLLDRLLC